MAGNLVYETFFKRSKGRKNKLEGRMRPEGRTFVMPALGIGSQRWKYGVLPKSNVNVFAAHHTSFEQDAKIRP